MEKQTQMSSDSQHTSELRDVSQGDSVTIHTTEGQTFNEIECDMHQRLNADPRSGEVRETHLWAFTVAEADLTVSIIDGLKSHPEQDPFPRHKPASLGKRGNYDGWEQLGYIESIEIHES